MWEKNRTSVRMWGKNRTAPQLGNPKTESPQAGHTLSWMASSTVIVCKARREEYRAVKSRVRGGQEKVLVIPASEQRDLYNDARCQTAAE